MFAVFVPKDIYLDELMSTACSVHVGGWAGVGACSAEGVGSSFFNHQVDPSRSDWTVLDARRWRFANHTNEGEMDAFFLGVKWAGRQHSFRGTILLFLTDSSVALGCIREGRSSKFRLRRRCQRLLALPLLF